MWRAVRVYGGVFFVHFCIGVMVAVIWFFLQNLCCWLVNFGGGKRAGSAVACGGVVLACMVGVRVVR